MSSERVEVRPGAYHDSVTLMQVSRTLADREGVLAAQVGMGTALNLDLITGMGFDVPAGAGANDLVVAVRAADDVAAEGALAALQGELAGAGTAASAAALAVVPRTVGAAARGGRATLALISVPGPHAFTEAMDAVEAGLHVMVFSDNVPVEQEVALKDAAAARGLLVMGPDCGTAVVGGVGLGFANVVRPGPVGLVAASGTGAQQLCCLLDAADVGVSHCLGVGGRDLSAAVGGRSTRQALAMLDADPGTELIVVVSKPPAPQVAEQIAGFAASLSTPVRLALLGAGRPDLTAAARDAVEAVGATWSPPRSWVSAAGSPPRSWVGAVGGEHRVLRGAFSGGTLCDEAMLIAAAALGPVASNIPLQQGWRLGAGLRADGHAMVDFGDDELTQGRPHPMIDSSLRVDWVLREAGAGTVLLLDVVLGHGAHPDPAADLAPAIERVAGDGAVVVSLCGTQGDPQRLDVQAEVLAGAGASVYLSNAAAARAAVELVSRGSR